MKFQIERLKLLAGLAIAILSLGSAGLLQISGLHQSVGASPAGDGSSLIAQQDDEIQAYASSKYDYWDAKVLADFWGTDTWEAKGRIGRKILWGEENVAYLEQFLVDARISALMNADPFDYYAEGYTYDDAELLRDFWGEASTLDTKVRIGQNLMMGNDEIVETALNLASNQ